MADREQPGVISYKGSLGAVARVKRALAHDRGNCKVVGSSSSPILINLAITTKIQK